MDDPQAKRIIVRALMLKSLRGTIDPKDYQYNFEETDYHLQHLSWLCIDARKNTRYVHDESILAVMLDSAPPERKKLLLALFKQMVSDADQ